MKVSVLFSLVLYAVLGCFTPALADVITDFDSDIVINKDASLDITDSINVDFGANRRHGIYLIIPVQYTRNNMSYTLPLHVTSVTTSSGVPENYTFTHQGHDVMIRIGDPDVTVHGAHFYKIKFKVARALNFFDNAPELYWNVTGDQWTYPIQRATAVVHVPSDVKQTDIRATSYVGVQGSTTNAESTIENGHVRFSTTQALEPGEGLTIVVGLPQGSVQQTPWWKEAWLSFVDWWPAYIFPLGTLACMWLLWWHSGRDEDGHLPIAVEWNPPTYLSPAEVGTLVDESCDMEDIISTLIDLAARGHLTIKQTAKANLIFFTKNDYDFTKTDPPETEKLSAHETEFLNGLFDYDLETGNVRSLSSLKANFYVHLPAIRNHIYQSLTSKGLFLDNPDLVRTRYRALAFFLLVVGLFLLIANRPFGVGTCVSALIAALFSNAMPAKSKEGSKAKRECLGFARFVRLAEKDRIEVLAKDDPTIFGRLLPYAMVLGAADQWATAFENLLTAPPDWYQSYTPYNTDFSTATFVDDLGSGMNTMRSTFISMPANTDSGGGGSTAESGSSGFSGGSSGGGFGGGGGGSW